MIYESLIVPSEFPTPQKEIKRALLTYDKVKLVEPSDRDLMPENSFMSTILGIPLMGINTGPIRPMGKVPKYDKKFDQLVESIKPAINQGLVEIISTYNKQETEKMTIGAVPMGGYPLNTKFIYNVYRKISQNQDFLKSAISHDRHELISLIKTQDNLALKGGGDGGINDIPALPLIDDNSLSKAEKESLTQIARARIAALIKYAGYCEQKNLVPLFSSAIYGNTATRILKNTQRLLSKDDDKFWTKRNRILELCHEEYLEDKFLEEISIEKVIEMRTKAWGKQANAREDLFSSIAHLSQEINDSERFYSVAKKKVALYREVVEELQLERKNLGFSIKCDICEGLLTGGSGLYGLLSQLQSPFESVGLTLAAGGVWALEKSKEYVPRLRKLKEREEKIDRGAGFGIQNFYTRIK